MIRRAMIETLESRRLLSVGINGLLGAYYDNKDLTGFKFNRTDPQINFNWGASSPDPSIGVDTFSIRWTGQLLAPTSDAYTLTLRGDDGVRLTIDGQVKIDSWVNSAMADRNVSVNLLAGQSYNIQIDYYENGGQAGVFFYWKTPSMTSRQLVPQANLYNGIPQVPPIAPTGLTASALSDSSVQLKWSDNSSDETGFKIERSLDGLAFLPVTTTLANQQSYVDSNLTGSTHYYYRVRATNLGADSDPSNLADATTLVAKLSTIRINLGGPAYTDSLGRAWQADAYFTGGQASTQVIDVYKTTDDPLYYTRRSSNFSYAIPVTNGDYTLSLRMTEISYGDVGKRQFNAFAEGKQLLTNYDIYANAGARTAITRRFAVTVADGTLNLNFANVVGNATISAIELTPGLPTDLAPNLVWRGSLVDSPLARVEAGSIQVGSKLYVMGGFYDYNLSVTSRLDIFDLATQKWTAGASLPEAQTHLALATDGQFIYEIGGQVGPGFSGNTVDAYKYDIANNLWTSIASLPQSRSAGVVNCINGTLYYAGGDLADRSTPSTSQWSLDLTDPNATWTARAALPIAEDHMATAVLGGQIYVIGGEHDHAGLDGVGLYTQHPYLFRYDPALDKWTRLADIPQARSHAEGSTLVINGKIVVLGGMIGATPTTNSVVQYDPITNVWSALTNMPQARKGGNAAWYNNQIWLFNGQVNGGTIYQTGLIATFELL